MARCLGVILTLFLLVFTESVVAQKPERPSLRERWKSLFSKSEKPKPASLPPKPNADRPQPKPIQITTRSGSLRKPGPEDATPVPKATPTFAGSLDRETAAAPRRLNPAPAKQMPQMPQRAAIQDQSVVSAGHEVQVPRKTMADWIRGLWSREKPAPPRWKPEWQMAPTPKLEAGADRSTSIDPRKVYRGPTANEPAAQPSSSIRPTGFSESGVPNTGTEFRGRRGTSY